MQSINVLAGGAANSKGEDDANPAKRSHCFSCSGFVNHATRLPACDSLTIPSRAKPLDQRQPNTRVENGSSATAPGDGCPRGHLRIKATVPSPLNLHCASSSPRQRIQSLNFEPCVPAGGKWYLQKGIRPGASSVHGLPVRKRDVRRVQPPVYSVDGPDSEVIKFEFLH